MKTAIHCSYVLAKYGQPVLDQVVAAGRKEQDTVEIEVSKLDGIIPGWRDPPPKVERGPGDKLEWLLHPFVVFMDSHFGTHLEGCAACRRRKENMNRWWNIWTQFLRNHLNKFG